jgi:type II secretory pathway component GspD/PulD (secretin)
VSQDGVPNQSTTEVTTSMLVDSGQTVFIGGLIKRTSEQIRDGVPVLGDLPVLGALFSNRSLSSVNTELVVLITPYIVDNDKVRLDGGKVERVNQVAAELEEQPRDIEENLDKLDYFEDMLVNDIEDL